MRPTLKPLVLYDADCGFCRKCVEVYNRYYPEQAEFQPLQTFRKPEHLANVNLLESLTVIDASGHVYRGARGVFEMWSKASWLGSMFRTFYRYVPFFAWVSERIYSRVARSRTCALE